jgi:hypothetical protein
VSFLAHPADTATNAFDPQNATEVFTVAIATNVLFYWGLFWLVLHGRLALKRRLAAKN